MIDRAVGEQGAPELRDRHERDHADGGGDGLHGGGQPQPASDGSQQHPERRSIFAHLSTFA